MRASRSGSGTGVPGGTKRTPCCASTSPALASRRELVIAPAIGAASSLTLFADRLRGRLRRSRTGSRIICEESFEVADRGCEAATRAVAIERRTRTAPTAFFSQFRANASLIMCRRGEYPRRPTKHPSEEMRLPTGILIVDDHPLFIEALELVVQGTFPDASVSKATSIDAARAILDKHGPFDLVLLDLSMPGTRGLEGVIELRTRYPKLPDRRRLRARRPAHHPRGDAMRRRRLHLQVVAWRRSRSRPGGRHVRLGGAAEGLSAAGAVWPRALPTSPRASPR